MRPTHAEIDLQAISQNVEALSELIAPSQVCAVVKADGYGHGDVPVAATAVEAGAAMLAVALVEEGIRLREGGIDVPILILSEPPAESAVDVAGWGLEPTVYSDRWLNALESTNSAMKVHVMVDTGMHRVGAPTPKVPDLVKAVDGSAKLQFASLWTHFAVADEDDEFTHRQMERFDQVAEDLDVPAVHLANTAGAILFPESRRDMCRIGLGIYGLHPCPETSPKVELRPAMRVVTHVSHVQRLPAGARPSYGRVRPLARESTVVTAPIGYADGYARGLTSQGVALIGGRRFPLAGTVTMDQIVIDVGNEDIDVGQEVVLMGQQGREEVTADVWAKALGTISYEVVCSIGPRVPRIYV